MITDQVLKIREAAVTGLARSLDIPPEVLTGEQQVDTNNPYAYCSCGHPWVRHDVEEYRGDGTETCCVEGCQQVGCPGRAVRDEAARLAEWITGVLGEITQGLLYPLLRAAGVADPEQYFLALGVAPLRAPGPVVSRELLDPQPPNLVALLTDARKAAQR